MKLSSRWVLAAPSMVGWLACGAPASAGIIYGGQEPPKWSWSNQQAKGEQGTLDWGLGSGNIFGAYTNTDSNWNVSTIDDQERKAQAKRIAWRGPDENRPRALTQEQLVSSGSSVADLGPTNERPNAASPGIFINYVPDLAGLSDKGGGTTVPLPPAFLLAAVGLAVAGAARRLGWGASDDGQTEAA